jgi:sulfide dehydrogenase cytochrome subunit
MVFDAGARIGPRFHLYFSAYNSKWHRVNAMWIVVPAKTSPKGEVSRNGQRGPSGVVARHWIPAFAGMTAYLFMHLCNGLAMNWAMKFGKRHAVAIVTLSALTTLTFAAVVTPYPNVGRDIAANCAACHGTDGRSRGAVPSLAGQDARAIVQSMRDFRDGRRPATVMQQLAKGYTDAQIEAAAAYFAAQAKP